MGGLGAGEPCGHLWSERAMERAVGLASLIEPRSEQSSKGALEWGSLGLGL